MKEACIKTSLMSLISTVLFFGYMGFNLFTNFEYEGAMAVVALVFLYATLLLSFFAVTPAMAHRYVTFRFGVVSASVKWGFFFLSVGVTAETVVRIFFFLCALAAVVSDLFMLFKAKGMNEEAAKAAIITHAPLLSVNELKQKQVALEYLSKLFIVTVITAAVMTRVEYWYDVFVHIAFLYVMQRVFKRVRLDGFIKVKLLYLVLYMTLVYALSLGLVYRVETIDSAVQTLPFALVMHAPLLYPYFRERDNVSKYFEAKELKKAH